MDDLHSDPLSWRSIREPDERVVLLRGRPARTPEAYDRYYARCPRLTLGDRWLEAFRRLTSFACSALVHLLLLVIVAEFVYIVVPAIEETVVTVTTRPAGARPEVPRPEPSKELEERKVERPAEAPRTAEEPPPASPTPVVGSGASEPGARPAPAGVLENIQELGETGATRLEGSGIYDGRREGSRPAALGRYGGNPASEAAVELGLRWLAEHQSEDGRWSAGRFARRCPPNELCGTHPGGEGMDPGVTGLALLAFLGAGYTHEPGPYTETVKRGLQWLLRRQDKEGYFYDSTTDSAAGGMYGHGVCTFALGEACALTRDAGLRPALVRAVGAIAKSQQPNGGWYYSPDPARRRSEFTLSVWQMMGLKSAMMAGVEVPARVLERAIKHVRDSCDPGGGYYYSARGSITMGATGAGLFARCMFGLAEGRTLENGLSYLDQFQALEPEMGRRQSWEHLYYWYYRTLVTFQMQGRRWREWNRKIRPFLVSTQRTRGHAAGSWTLIDYQQAGTVYGTALCVLMLETYYRYLPVASDRSALDAVTSAFDGSAEEPMTREEQHRLESLQPLTAEQATERRRRDLEEARKRLKSEKPEDRYLGARRLAEEREKEALPGMIEAARRAEGRLKAAHLLFLGPLKSDEAIPFLAGFLDDADRDVRAAAVSALMNTTGLYIAEAERWKEWWADRLKKGAAER